MEPTLTQLKNSLRVVLVPCEAESVAFGLFVASGSRHEPERFGGISHFIEHMLFKGTPKRTALEITQAIEGRGGMCNACTSEESTSYFVHLPSEYLSEAVDILADMYLNASIDEEEFERERDVIIEEIKMYEDEPDSLASEKLQAGLFPSHPLGRPVAGTAETLRAMRTEDMREYMRSHYTPDATVAVLAGAFDSGEALGMVEAAFSGAARGRSRGGAGRKRGWRSGTAPSRPPVPDVRNFRDVQQAQLALGFRTFGVRDERKYAAAVLDAVLGRGMSSRLFQEIREKRGLSYDISSRWQMFEDTGMFTISAGLDPSKAEEALDVIQGELRKVATAKVGEDELARTKEFLTGNFRLSHEKVLSKMIYHGAMTLTYGRLVPTAEQVARIRAVTAGDVLSVARDVFVSSKRTVSWVLPKAK